METEWVIIHFEYTGESIDALHRVEDELETAIEAAGAGELDGDEMAVDLSDGAIYLDGQDAEALYTIARPIIMRAACLRHVRIVIRRSGPNGDISEREEFINSSQ